LAARRAGAELTILCVNNGGGGIFDFLPVADHADAQLYERHIATPAGVELPQLAELAGLPYRPAATPDDVRQAAREPGLIEVRTDRADSVRLHRELAARVARDLLALR
jgi:2-succinyl-5-enolpyruvyl-6-hydroxy-3-cyclohexene-1-carboxylate synthase